MLTLKGNDSDDVGRMVEFQCGLNLELEYSCISEPRNKRPKIGDGSC
jgi:hypothetical protein